MLLYLILYVTLFLVLEIFYSCDLFLEHIDKTYDNKEPLLKNYRTWLAIWYKWVQKTFINEINFITPACAIFVVPMARRLLKQHLLTDFINEMPTGRQQVIMAIQCKFEEFIKGLYTEELSK